jgi:ribonuclease HI
MNTLIIYTDGSHLDKQKKQGGRLGAGGVIVKPMYGQPGIPLGEFSQELDFNDMRIKYGATDPSNPTAEMMAVLIALQTFKKQLKQVDKVIMKADYLGCKEWNLGNWKIKEPYIQKIKDEIDKEIEEQNLEGRIDFEWVRGHQKGYSPDVYWNNYVDLLAKGEKW